MSGALPGNITTPVLLAQLRGLSGAIIIGRRCPDCAVRLRSRLACGRYGLVYATCQREGWASCPITQNGCVRIMSNAAYPHSIPVQAIVTRLAEACAEDVHEFWPDRVSILDPKGLDVTRIHNPRQLTDAYLLALAVSHAARLVTFDGQMPLAAVRRSKSQNLLVI